MSKCATLAELEGSFGRWQGSQVRYRQGVAAGMRGDGAVDSGGICDNLIRFP